MLLVCVQLVGGMWRGEEEVCIFHQFFSRLHDLNKGKESMAKEKKNPRT